MTRLAFCFGNSLGWVIAGRVLQPYSQTAAGICFAFAIGAVVVLPASMMLFQRSSA